MNRPLDRRLHGSAPGERWLAAWLACLLIGPIFVLLVASIVSPPLGAALAMASVYFAIPCSVLLLIAMIIVRNACGVVRFGPCVATAVVLPLVETGFFFGSSMGLGMFFLIMATGFVAGAAFFGVMAAYERAER